MSVADELEKLEVLLEDGVLTDEEFQQAKKTVLEGGAASAAVGGRVADSEYIRQQTKQWAMLLHISQFASCVVPLAGLIAPIVIWQIKKDELPEIDKHGKVVVNWIISFLIYAVISVILCFVLIGIPLLIVLIVVSVVFPIMGGIKANNGEVWRYPTSISFLEVPPNGATANGAGERNADSRDQSLDNAADRWSERDS